MTVKELLFRIDSRELTEWQGFESLEPFGDRRADIHTAQIVTAIFNAIGPLVAGKKFKPRTIQEMIIDLSNLQGDNVGPELTPEETVEAMAILTAQLGGKDLRGQNGESRQPVSES